MTTVVMSCIDRQIRAGRGVLHRGRHRRGRVGRRDGNRHQRGGITVSVGFRLRYRASDVVAIPVPAVATPFVPLSVIVATPSEGAPTDLRGEARDARR